MKEEYAVEVKNRYEILANKGKAVWEYLKESMVTSAIDLIPKKRKIMKQRWTTEEILEFLRKKAKDQRQEVTRIQNDREQN